MTRLNSLIRSLTVDEQTRFKNYLQNKNRRGDTKNIELFNLLLNSELSNQTIFESLYTPNKRGAYHALRKRLHDSLIEFIAHENLENENSLESGIIKLIVAARSLFFKKQYKTAYLVLEKAEKLAQENLLYPLLAEVHHTQIQYAYCNPEINLTELIQNSDLNLKQYILEEKLNHIYAQLRLIVNQTRESQLHSFPQLIENQLNKHNISIENDLSFKSLYQLSTLASLAAYTTKDYNSIESFLTNCYQKIKQQTNRFSQSFYHIQVLYQLANMYFRNKKFQQAFSFLDSMHQEMLSNSKKHYKTFLLKHQNLLALCYNYTNQNSLAIEIAQDNISKKHPDSEITLDVKLCLSMYYFHKEDFKSSLKTINSLYHSDNWYRKKTNEEWIIKKNLIELLIHIELDNFNLVESRLLSFKRKHFSYLKEQHQNRVITFILLIEEYYLINNNIVTTELTEKIKTSFEFKEARLEDIFVMSFYSWLKSKITNSNTYTTTLDMIKNC
ncbi:tetratricopeptide repeat protein [Pseudofulvibacter geojedonensis]|uniref:Tol-pal system YbgF family protein n=1 Tax=Pseudofulvibacter geojedonensis TaxID=1123758 RepID=A0ABW3I4P1_9FLAO